VTPRARLKKQEKDDIKKMLSDLRLDGKALTISDTNDYVWGYVDGEPVIGFRWASKKGWRVFIPFTIHCHQDLETVRDELQRVHACTRAMSEAWESFQKSRSDKNFMSYQGFVAALFMGGDIT